MTATHSHRHCSEVGKKSSYKLQLTCILLIKIFFQITLTNDTVEDSGQMVSISFTFYLSQPLIDVDDHNLALMLIDTSKRAQKNSL